MFVFPMAGLSSRFAKAGYKRPKYMLDVGGRSLFWHAVSGFRRYFHTHEFLFVMRDVDGTPEFVERECARLGITAPRFVVLDAPTSGQAETVAEGIRQSGCDLEKPLTVFNIDSMRRHFRFPDHFDMDGVDGYLETFTAPGDHWSFVRPCDGTSAEAKVAEVAEKTRISDLCSTGLYHFRTGRSFMEAYERTESIGLSDLQGGERYVAPLYNLLIEAGKDVRYHHIDADDVAFCGTPEEYDAFLASVPDRPRTAGVITGRLRDIGDAYATLRKATELRDEGLLETLVLSTWRGEIDQFAGLREDLVASGVAIVESDCPPQTIKPFGMWVSWIQAAALQRGIDAAGDADCILKLRTDKCASYMEMFRPALQDTPLPSGRLSPLRGIVSVRMARAAIPLHVSDIIYYGFRSDIEAMIATAVSGEMQYDALNGWTGVETRWAAGPWFRANPLYRSYHAGVDAFAAARAMMSWAETTPGQKVPEALARVMALGWRVLSDGFHAVDSRPLPGERLPEVPLSDAFHPDDTRLARTVASRRGATRNFLSQEIIDGLARGRFADTSEGAVFRDAIASLDTKRSVRPLSGKDYAEIGRFLSAHGERKAAVAAPLSVTHAAGFDGSQERFSEGAAFAMICRSFGAPMVHEEAVKRIATETPQEAPGTRSHAIARAYVSGGKGLPQSASLALKWMWIGAELRHKPSVTGYAELVIAQSEPDQGMLQQAMSQLRVSGLEASEVAGRVAALMKAGSDLQN